MESIKTRYSRRSCGQSEASSTRGLIKQRVARAGQGRSGGYRVLVAFRTRHRAVFLYGFAKRERENIARDELLTLRDLASAWLAADAKQLAEALKEDVLKEVAMTKTKNPSRLTKALLETADDMRRVGVLNDKTHKKSHCDI